MRPDFHIEAPYDQRFTTSVHVDTEGHFSTTLPETITTLLAEHGIKTGQSRAKKWGYYRRDTLAGLKEAVGADLKTLCSEKEIDRREIIRYAIATACSYAISKDGQFMPFADPDMTDGTGWHDGTVERNANCRGPFGIQVYAHCYRKITYRFDATGKERVEYESMREFNHSTERCMADDVQWLCNIPCLAPTSDRFGEYALKTSEIPLTSANAAFFVNLLKSLFSLNEKLKPFLNPEGIQTLAILAKGRGLLGPTKVQKEIT